MAAHKKDQPRININLLHPQGSGNKLPVRFLQWLLAYGRYIVVIVEIIVLISFGARFKLDADLNSLKKEVNEQVDYVKGKIADESIIKLTQTRIETIQKTYNQTPDWKNILNKISAQLPENITLAAISLDNSAQPLSFRLNGKSTSTGDLSAFVSGLKEEKVFDNINLTGISFDQGEISFTITGQAKKGGT